MNNKGSLFDIIVWVILAFVILIFLGFFLYGHQLVTDSLENVGSFTVGTTEINVSQVSSQTIGQINTAEQRWLPIIAFIIIICEALTIMITNFFIREHPLMFIPYIFIVAIAVVVSAYISNAYQDLLSGYPFSLYLMKMTMGNYIMIYLPYWTTVIGAIGTILLVAQIVIPQQSGGGSA